MNFALFTGLAIWYDGLVGGCMVCVVGGGKGFGTGRHTRPLFRLLHNVYGTTGLRDCPDHPNGVNGQSTFYIVRYTCLLHGMLHTWWCSPTHHADSWEVAQLRCVSHLSPVY